MADQVKVLIRAILEDKEFQKKVKGMGADFDETGKSAKGFFSKIKVGFIASVAAIGGAVLAFAKLTKIAKEFESGIARVASVTGKKFIPQLEKFARQTAVKTKFTAREAADALFFLASAGLEVAEMGKVLTPALNLATAGNLEIAEATDLVIGNLKVFAEQGLEASEAVDILTRTNQKANTDVRQLGQALSFAGSTASLLNVPFTDLNALLGVMADQGIKGTRAGTQLRMAMIRLIKPTSQAADIFENKLGLSLEDVNNILVDPAKGLIHLLELVNKGNLTVGESTTIFGARQQNVIKLIKSGLPTVRDLAEELQNAGGAAKAAADIQLDTLEGKILLLKSAFEELVLSISEKTGVIGGLKSLVGFVTNLIKPSNDVEEITGRLIKIQREYSKVIREQNKAQKENNTLVANQKRLRGEVLELQFIKELNLLGVAYGDQIAKLKGLNKVNEIAKKGFASLEEQMGKAENANSKINIGFSEAIALGGKYLNTYNQIGFTTERVKDVSNDYSMALENVKEKSVTLKTAQEDLDTQIRELANAYITMKDAGQATFEITDLLKGKDEELRQGIIKQIAAIREQQEVKAEAAIAAKEQKEEEAEAFKKAEEDAKRRAEEEAEREEQRKLKRAETIDAILEFEGQKNEKLKKMGDDELADHLKKLKKKKDEEDNSLKARFKRFEAHAQKGFTTAKKFTSAISTIADNEMNLEIERFKKLDENDTEARDKQKAKIKELFKVNKATKITEAVIDAAAAVLRTMASVAFPFNIPLVALQVAAGAAQVSVIRRQKMPSFQQGAERTTAGPAILHAGERVVPANLNIPNLSNEALVAAATRGLAIEAGGANEIINNNNSNSQSMNFAGANFNFPDVTDAQGVMDELVNMADDMNSSLFRR